MSNANEIINSLSVILPPPISHFEFIANGTTTETADGSVINVPVTLRGLVSTPTEADYIPSLEAIERFKEGLINFALSLGGTIEETRFDSPDFIYEVIFRKNGKTRSMKYNARTTEVSLEMADCEINIGNATARI